jgi:HAE1 family hydrophobic/amphiphilic exporter-1
VYVNDVNLGTQVNRVTVMSDWSSRSSADRVGDLYVRSKTGDMVPVGSLVTFSEELGVRDCYRCNQYLYATCQFLPKEGVASSEAIEEVRRISAETLPRGYVQDWSGLIYEQFQSRGDTGILMALSFLAVYLVLMVMSGSLVRPLLSLVPAAAATLGAVVLHLVTGVPMSLYSQFSILLLGVICSALSMLTDPRESASDRAFLPILITISFLPLALSFGAGSAGSRSIGIAMLGGFAFFALIRMLGGGLDFSKKES